MTYTIPETVPHSSRPLLQINLGAIADNYRALAATAAPAKVGASVKADAYGLGAKQIGRVLYKAGCRTFFVAHAKEGKTLRDALGADADIYTLSGPTPGGLTSIFEADLKPVINSVAQAELWINAIQGQDKPACALHFDTGINRLGIQSGNWDKFVMEGELFKSLNVDLVMSHLACGALTDHPMNRKQLGLFKTIIAGYPGLPTSLANTGGVYLGPDFHFDMVRPGIGIYGGGATDKPSIEKNTPAVSLRAPIIQKKAVKKGETMGYNASFVAKKDMVVGIASVGYADGLPVALSGSSAKQGAMARIGKTSVPIVGRVSMDYTILDITNIDSKVRLGDMAVFLGAELDKQALQAGTINYELLTHLGSRCKRVYIK